MPRIAVAGFHHETNSFVTPPTDFTYFASHRDRPPLVRGSDVTAWLGDTSFALSGFLREMAARHEIVPLLWTSGGPAGPPPPHPSHPPPPPLLPPPSPPS